MARVSVTRRAGADVDGILAFLHANAGLQVADNLRRELRTTLRRLESHPESGAPRPIYGRRIRLVTIEAYVALYRYDRADDTVYILRILHGRRRLGLDAP